MSAFAAAAVVVLAVGCAHGESAPAKPEAAAAASTAAPAVTSGGGCQDHVDAALRSHRPKQAPPAEDVEVPGGPVYGDPEAASRFWQPQSQQDCGLMATRLVVGEVTGDPPSEADMIALATKTPSRCSPGEMIYNEVYEDGSDTPGDGTCTNDLPILLQHFGIQSQYSSDEAAASGGPKTGMTALKEYLAGGRQVIACVASATIWDGKTDPDGCSHLVTVAAIDTDTEVAYLGDSGGDDTQGEQVPLDTFETAWAAGGHEMVVTAP